LIYCSAVYLPFVVFFRPEIMSQNVGVLVAIELVELFLVFMVLGINRNMVVVNSWGEIFLDKKRVHNEWRSGISNLLDLFACVPLYLAARIIIYAAGTKKVWWVSMLCLNRMFRFHRFLDNTKNTNLFLTVTKLLSSYLLLCHWVAAVFFSISYHNHNGNPVSWFIVNKLDKMDFSTQFVTSFYWAVVTLSAIESNMYPQNNSERVFSSIIAIVGLMAFSYLFGNVQLIIAALQQTKMDHRISAWRMADFSKDHCFAPSLSHRVRRAVKAVYRSNRGHDSSFLAQLPVSVRDDVQVEIHNALIANCLHKILQEADMAESDHHSHEQFIRSIIVCLKKDLFLPSDTVCRRGDASNALYFLKRGELAVYTFTDERKRKYWTHYKEGCFFGEVGFVTKAPRTAFIEAIVTSEVFSLDREDWERLPDVIYKQQLTKAFQELGMKNLKHKLEKKKTTFDAVEDAGATKKKDMLASSAAVQLRKSVVPTEFDSKSTLGNLGSDPKPGKGPAINSSSDGEYQNLVLQTLQNIQSDVALFRNDMSAVKAQVSAIETQMEAFATALGKKETGSDSEFATIHVPRKD